MRPDGGERPRTQRDLLVLLTRSARRRAIASTLAGLFALATRAAAQDSQYWDIQYGPVGQLLGGQVVGSTRDLSATYYNPGGLALGEDPDFLLSVQAFKRQDLTSKPVEGGAYLDNSDTESGDASRASWPSRPPRAGSGRRRASPSRLLTRQEAVQLTKQRFAGNEPAAGAVTASRHCPTSGCGRRGAG